MTDRKSFLLRLNPNLHRVLERWAAAEMRSLNSQIEFLLVEAARKAGRWKDNETTTGSRSKSDQIDG